MDREVQDGGRAEPVGGQRPRWRTPTLAEYDIIAITEITNCGNGDDGVICQSAS